MPKVSIILTSYNHDKYIREAIDTVLKQTFTDFELIIWDDTSSDDSWALINQYTDARIKAFRNDVNEGPVFGINKAISEITTGDYIAIHHSDDAWQLNKLEKQVDFLEAHHDVGAVFTWAQIIDDQGEEQENNYFIQENKTRWQWLQQLFTGNNHLNHPSILIRKQCYQEVGLYRYSLAQTPDAEMWSRLLIKFPIHVIQEKLTKHRLFLDSSNTSGYRIDVKIRISNEWNVIRENFLALTYFDDIVAIFPSLERYRNPAGCDNKFLLAMACLYECKQRNAWQLGLFWLFQLLNDNTRYQKIAEIYAFSYADFIKLTAEFDVYDIEAIAHQAQEIHRLDEVVVAKDTVIAHQAQEIHRLADVIVAKDTVIAHQAQEILRLDDVIVAKDTVIICLKEEIAKIHLLKWYRLGKALKTRPMTLHNFARIFYLSAGLITPNLLRKKAAPIISKIRQRCLNTQKPLFEEMVESKTYIVKSPTTIAPVRQHIVHVIANFMTGGSSRLVVDLIENLSDQYSQEVLTSFIPDPPAYDGLEIEECKAPIDETPFIEYFQRTRPDFIHVHYWGDCDEPWYAKAIEAARQLGLPVIENINTPIAPYISDAIVRYVYVSDYVRHVFGRANSQHITIYPGSNFSHFNRDLDEKIPGDCVGMVYRLENDKLNEQSIEPFIRIVQRRPQTRVLIVGGGSLLEPFQKAVEVAGVKNSFEFTGYVSYDSLPELYRRMSVFITPVWKESFGQVSPFAMNMRIPVIGYDIGAIGEIIDNPQLLAPAANADQLADIAINLLDSPESREHIGFQQASRAQSLFSVQAMIESYSKLYAEIGLTQKSTSL